MLQALAPFPEVTDIMELFSAVFRAQVIGGVLLNMIQAQRGAGIFPPDPVRYLAATLLKGLGFRYAVSRINERIKK